MPNIIDYMFYNISRLRIVLAALVTRGVQSLHHHGAVETIAKVRQLLRPKNDPHGEPVRDRLGFAGHTVLWKLDAYDANADSIELCC